MPSIQKRIDYALLDTNLPAMTDTSIAFLEKRLNNSHVVFEWGSGASTFWFANRCNTVWSVEYFKDFYEVLVERAEEYSNINLFLKEPDNKPQEGYIAKHSSASGKSFKNFAHAIDVFRDQYFDVIVIDGRVRNRCLDLAIPKLKEGGFIIYDDTNRDAYLNYILPVVEDHFEAIIQLPGVTPDNKRSITSILYNKKITLLSR